MSSRNFGNTHHTLNYLAGCGGGKDTTIDILSKRHPGIFTTFGMSDALRELAQFDSEVGSSMDEYGGQGLLLPAPIALKTARWWLECRCCHSSTNHLFLNGACRQWGEWPILRELQEKFGYQQNIIALGIHPDDVLLMRMERRARKGETAEVRANRIKEWHKTIHAARLMRSHGLAIVREVQFDGSETPEEVADVVGPLLLPHLTN
jgi:hypothetical protein